MTQKVVNQFTFRCPNFFDQIYLVPWHDPDHRYNLLVKLVKTILPEEFMNLLEIIMQKQTKDWKKLTKLVHFRNE